MAYGRTTARGWTLVVRFDGTYWQWSAIDDAGDVAAHGRAKYRQHAMLAATRAAPL